MVTASVDTCQRGITPSAALDCGAGGVEWTDVSAAFPASEDDQAKWLALGGNLTTNVPMLVMGGKVCMYLSRPCPQLL